MKKSVPLFIMTEYCILAIILILVCISLIIRKQQNQANSLPSGPGGFPILGNLPQLGTTPHIKLHHWAEKFGKLYTIYFLQKPVLIINDAKLIKQLLSMMPATPMFKTEVLSDITGGANGIGNTSGETWLEQRHFFIKALKLFGFGRGQTMEMGVVKEVEKLSKWLETEQRNNGNVVLHQRLKECAAGLLWNMVSGEKIESGDSQIVYLTDEFMKCLQKVTRSGLIFFPFLKHVAPNWSGYTEYQLILNKMHSLVQQYIDKHLENKNGDNLPRDVIDVYIEKVEQCTDKQSSFYGKDGYRHIFGSVIAMLLGGSESTGTIINWALFYLTVNQKAQKMLQKEIDEIIGPSRDPCIVDRLSMPYMEAVILETLRLSSTGPMGVMHELSESVNFEGYTLPKDMLIISNLYHVHYNQAIWKDPENFRPERFLDGSESLKEFVVAFQPGKRSCPGESQVKDILFLFVTKLMQQFDFLMDGSVNNPNEYLKAENGMALLPQNLPVVVRKRC